MLPRNAFCKAGHLRDCIIQADIVPIRKFAHIKLQILGTDLVVNTLVRPLQHRLEISIPFICAIPRTYAPTL